MKIRICQFLQIFPCINNIITIYKKIFFLFLPDRRTVAVIAAAVGSGRKCPFKLWLFVSLNWSKCTLKDCFQLFFVFIAAYTCILRWTISRICLIATIPVFPCPAVPEPPKNPPPAPPFPIPYPSPSDILPLSSDSSTPSKCI